MLVTIQIDEPLRFRKTLILINGQTLASEFQSQRNAALLFDTDLPVVKILWNNIHNYLIWNKNKKYNTLMQQSCINVLYLPLNQTD